MSGNRIPKEKLLADLRAVAQDIGHPPRTKEYRERGEFGETTIRERIGTWDEALRAADLSPAEKPNASSDRHPGYPVTCPQCGADAKADPEARKQECRQCGHVYHIDHARIAFFGGSDSVTSLADGPKASADLSTRPERHPGVVDRLKAPDRVTQEAKPRPETTVVYYLVGDERRAIDRFIEVNEAYVRDCLEDTPNPLQHNWSDELYHLLLEQWHWNGYGDY